MIKLYSHILPDFPDVEIVILDGLSAAEGMYVSARYSRSKKSVRELLWEGNISFTENNPSDSISLDLRAFMNRTISEYGHVSVGDSGALQVHIEGIPMMIAPLIQSSPLYSGTERSSRYLKFDGNDAYVKVFETEKEYAQNTLGMGKDAARIYALDVARGYLSANTKTGLTYCSNIREIANAAFRLKNTKVPNFMEQHQNIIYAIGEGIESCLKFAGYVDFTSSNSEKRSKYAVYGKDDRLNLKSGFFSPKRYNYINIDPWFSRSRNYEIDYVSAKNTVPFENENFPITSSLCSNLYANIMIKINSDFAAYREINRHRLINVSNIEKESEFNYPHSWYLRDYISAPNNEFFLGTPISAVYSASLQEWIYFCILRSGDSAHPILREIAAEIKGFLLIHFGQVSAIENLLNKNSNVLETNYEKRKKEEYDDNSIQ